MEPRETPPRVSDWDREYMKRLGRYKEAANADSLSRHLALSGYDRIVASLRLSLEYASPASIQAALDDDDPSEFYARARRLGLITPRT